MVCGVEGVCCAKALGASCMIMPAAGADTIADANTNASMQAVLFTLQTPFAKDISERAGNRSANSTRYEPSPWKITSAVRRMIFKSESSDQFSM